MLQQEFISIPSSAIEQTIVTPDTTIRQSGYSGIADGKSKQASYIAR